MPGHHGAHKDFTGSYSIPSSTDGAQSAPVSGAIKPGGTGGYQHTTPPIDPSKSPNQHNDILKDLKKLEKENVNTANQTDTQNNVTDNQQTVKQFISSGEDDANFKSYTSINYANSDIQNLTQKINAILAADPTWTKMDAINYLDGKWTKKGYNDNTPRWNNGNVKDLVVSDKIKGIKGEKDYNTWGGGLRSRFEGNWGTLTSKDVYNTNLDIRANSQYLEPGSAAFNRNKALGEASKSLGVNQKPLEAIFGTVAQIVGLPLFLLSGLRQDKREAIEKKERGMLETSVITEDIRNLMGEYNLSKQNFEDTQDMGVYGTMMDLENRLKNAVGGDLPAVLRSMSMDEDNIIFNEPMNEGEFKNFKTRLRLIEEERDNHEEPHRNAHGDMVNNTIADDTTEVADNTTIDLADPYIGVAWWQDRGGFEKLFGIELPYPKSSDTVQDVAKEGGIVGYQTGGSVRQPKMIQDPNAAPASMRADDVNLQAETGDFIMGHPAMQQYGTRVRSLVEQAMLKAKNAGVKTKGYKSGDKVDILVHNGEMQIPNEIVKYIDGGYTTLKKLNAPSKHQEGETVEEKGFMQKPQDDKLLGEMQNDLTTTQKSKTQEAEVEADIFHKRKVKTRSDIDKEKEEERKDNIFYDKGFSRLEDDKWTFLKNKFQSYLPKNLKRHEERAYTGVAMNDLYNSLSGASQEKNRDIYNKLNTEKFLTGLHKASKNNMLLSNIHRLFGKDLTYKAYLNDRNIAYKYNNSSLFSAPVNAKKEYRDDTTLIDFLKRMENEGYKEQSFYVDASDKVHIGYGHKIEGGENSDEYKMFQKIINENNGIFPETLALELLKKDKINFTNKARKVFNSFAKSNANKKYGNNSMKVTDFNSLQPAVRDMLVDFAFNLGASEIGQFGDGATGLAEYDDFMTAASQGDYEKMAKEYKRFIIDKKTNTKTELKRRNEEFYDTWLSPNIDKLVL
jgi:GH24 family phage-related lysozyme (muramidase)